MRHVPTGSIGQPWCHLLGSGLNLLCSDLHPHTANPPVLVSVAACVTQLLKSRVRPSLAVKPCQRRHLSSTASSCQPPLGENHPGLSIQTAAALWVGVKALHRGSPRLSCGAGLAGAGPRGHWQHCREQGRDGDTHGLSLSAAPLSSIHGLPRASPARAKTGPWRVPAPQLCSSRFPFGSWR